MGRNIFYLILGSLSVRIIKRFATCYNSLEYYESIYFKDAASCAYYNLCHVEYWKDAISCTDPFGKPIVFDAEGIEMTMKQIYLDRHARSVEDIYFILGSIIVDRVDLICQFKKAFNLSDPTVEFVKIFQNVESSLRKVNINYNDYLNQFLQVFCKPDCFEETLYFIPYDLKRFEIPEELADYCC